MRQSSLQHCGRVTRPHCMAEWSAKWARAVAEASKPEDGRLATGKTRGADRGEANGATVPGLGERNVHQIECGTNSL